MPDERFLYAFRSQALQEDSRKLSTHNMTRSVDKLHTNRQIECVLEVSAIIASFRLVKSWHKSGWIWPLSGEGSRSCTWLLWIWGEKFRNLHHIYAPKQHGLLSITHQLDLIDLYNWLEFNALQKKYFPCITVGGKMCLSGLHSTAVIAWLTRFVVFMRP